MPPILTLRPSTFFFFSPTLHVSQTELDQIKATPDRAALQSGGNTWLDWLFDADRLNAKHALHCLIHGADAKTMVRSFALLRGLVPEHDRAHFHLAPLDEDTMELTIRAPGGGEPLACVQVPRLGTFGLADDPDDPAYVRLVYGDPQDPLLMLRMHSPRLRAELTTFEPAYSRLNRFFDRGTVENERDPYLLRFCEVVIAHLRTRTGELDLEAAFNATVPPALGAAPDSSAAHALAALPTRVADAFEGALKQLVKDLKTIKQDPKIWAYVYEQANRKLKLSAIAQAYRDRAHEQLAKLALSAREAGNFTFVDFCRNTSPPGNAKTKLRINS
ncbi:hypothetical protein [Pandoraea oxalativorans]|uniref:Uncharacterized protein n=1 Tax=Pandoraea oxalativorans TaxID=573737 RepID=A0A0G3IFS1_9BURK|nr:hypothetical protein [Pandoraea oxalativorans]AKK24751.1 hypothetical protein MB84_28525 [Pandoraea oxalativorans]